MVGFLGRAAEDRAEGGEVVGTGEVVEVEGDLDGAGERVSTVELAP